MNRKMQFLTIFAIIVHLVICRSIGAESHPPFDFPAIEKLSEIVCIVSFEGTSSISEDSGRMNPEYYRRFVSKARVLLAIKGCQRDDVVHIEHFRLKKPLANHASFPRFSESMNLQLDQLDEGESVANPLNGFSVLVFLKKDQSQSVCIPATGIENAEYAFHTLDGKNDELLSR